MYLINICKRTLKIYMGLLGLGRISGIAGITDIRTDPNCIVIKGLWQSRVLLLNTPPLFLIFLKPLFLTLQGKSNFIITINKI